MQSARERIVKAVREFHQKSPLLPGMPRQELRGRRARNSCWTRCWRMLKEVVAEGEIVRLALAQAGT